MLGMLTVIPIPDIKPLRVPRAAMSDPMHNVENGSSSERTLRRHVGDCQPGRRTTGEDPEKPKTGKSAALQQFLGSTCSRCSLSLHNSTQLFLHLQSCEGDVQVFICSLCFIPYNTLAHLREHLWKSHMTIPEKLKCGSTAGGNPNNPNPWVCQICNVGKKNRMNFVMHLSVPFAHRCNQVRSIWATTNGIIATDDEEDQKKTVNVQDPIGPGEEDDCVFLCYSELDIETTESVSCEVCGRFFTTVQEAREHYKAFPSGPRLVCFICGDGCVTACDAALNEEA